MTTLFQYIKDNAGRYVYVSESILDVMHFDAQHIIGHSDLDLPGQSENVYAWMEEDKRIQATGKNEYVINKVFVHGTTKWQRTLKSPVYGRNGKIQGISGCSIFISDTSLIPLTKQQNACIKYIAMGYTQKQIANEMGLSHKTVEHYLEAVKLKLNCQSRADLIMQAIERGLLGVF